MKSHIIALAIMSIVCIDISRAEGIRTRFNKAALKMKGRHVEDVDHWSGSGNNGGPGGLSLPYSRGMTFGDYDDGRKYGRKTNRRRVVPEPCIGVCLHKKLLLAERLQAALSKVNERQDQPKNAKSHKYGLTPPRIEAPSTTTSPVLPPGKPCVGICHHYRTLGLPYPF